MHTSHTHEKLEQSYKITGSKHFTTYKKPAICFNFCWNIALGNVRAKWDTVRRKAKLARQSVALQPLAAERLFALFTGWKDEIIWVLSMGFCAPILVGSTIPDLCPNGQFSSRLLRFSLLPSKFLFDIWISFL